MTRGQFSGRRILMAGVALSVLAACEDFDFDLRDRGGGFDTTRAVQELPNRPRPDDRGVISYPNYQVVVARRDDTIRGIAIRLGLDANELAEYNGIEPDVILRRDEIIALPTRVAEPSLATGADSNGPIQTLDVAAVATSALDRADAAGTVTTAPLAPTPAAAPAPVQAAAEPIRHQVVRGETAFSISRLYNVSVSRIAEWNGLDSQFTIREGQFLLIPQDGAAPATAPTAVSAPVTAPGEGTETPVPPSAAEPLPVAAAPVAAPEAPPAPDLGTPTSASAARFVAPVQGSIIRGYAPGSNEGIDFGVPAGTSVQAAGSGTVAAVTTDTTGGSIVVIKHDDGLLTVYTQMNALTVSKNDTVSSGQKIGEVRAADTPFLHFEVRRGLQSVDPTEYLP
ncbi:LysM peptidoglycan-binding domain-containing M23 family metallopeptidase [Cognatiyoonia sp. IB215446]|uniref:LysM peptidoglycan-binding domain-containing M23 family metallopeptidase n=1 Tax=Cognatiyoonia sp. IB215446 TaxID=3097355 RepID=UPI002A118DB2|nr:LysM peptidoglycan-binding domain-containing M23 family metallopeptidase [Cognatiyoonia sp. IB215446]MDX8348490.1 LysM peptidoglycan-binding domain-containing M23 family metallopeptidase [Cognatiyoonia sp. IB215446]